MEDPYSLDPLPRVLPILRLCQAPRYGYTAPMRYLIAALLALPGVAFAADTIPGPIQAEVTAAGRRGCTLSASRRWIAISWFSCQPKWKTRKNG